MANPFLDRLPDEDKKAIEFGQGNVGQDKTSLRDEFKPDPFAWADTVASPIMAELAGWADINGVSRSNIGSLWTQRSPLMFNALHSDLFVSADSAKQNAHRIIRQEIAQGVAKPEEFGVQGMGREYYTSTLKGMNEMVQWARDWWAKQGFQLKPSLAGGGGSGRGRGSGGGARKATPEEIRNQFDLKELADAVNDMSRGIVLDEHKDPMGLARKYVDAVVATGGEKKIDFETFVRGDIENTSRFKNIYINKPKSVKAEDYLAPYFQAAMGLARPDDAADIAIGGAQFGASSQAFQSRLEREDSVTGSAPFINGLQGRLQELNSVFKGA